MSGEEKLWSVRATEDGKIEFNPEYFDNTTNYSKDNYVEALERVAYLSSALTTKMGEMERTETITINTDLEPIYAELKGWLFKAKEVHRMRELRVQYEQGQRNR